MGAFWELIQDHLDKMEFPPSKRRLAERLDVVPQTITNWQQGLTELPKRRNIEAVASFVGKSYGSVLAAALADAGYGRGAGFTMPRGDAAVLGELFGDGPSVPDEPDESPVIDGVQSGDQAG